MTSDFGEKIREYEWISSLRVRLLRVWNDDGHSVAWVALEAPSFPVPPKVTLMCACEFTVETILPTGLGDAEYGEDGEDADTEWNDGVKKELPSGFGYRIGSSSLSCPIKEAVEEMLQREARRCHAERWTPMTIQERVEDVFRLSCAGEPMGQQYADELTVAEIAGILDIDIKTTRRAVGSLEVAGTIRPSTIGSVFYVLTREN